MKAYEMIETTHHEVACDGGGGALGHPRVFLHIDETKGQIVCPYCSKTYVLKSCKKEGLSIFAALQRATAIANHS